MVKCAHRSARHFCLHRPSLLADMPVQCGVPLCTHDGHGIPRPCRVPAPALRRLGLPLRLCLGTRRHGYEDKSSGKKLRWCRLQILKTKLLKTIGIQLWESMGFNGIRWDSMGFMTSAQKWDLQAACANCIGPAKGILTVYSRGPNKTQTLTAGGKCPFI